MLITDFTCDIKKKLLQLNGMLISLADRKLTAKGYVMITHKLSDIIEFHSEARQLSVTQID